MRYILPEEISKATRGEQCELQLTPDVELALEEMERGETITLSEFRKMFLRWRDIQ